MRIVKCSPRVLVPGVPDPHGLGEYPKLMATSFLDAVEQTTTPADTLIVDVRTYGRDDDHCDGPFALHWEELRDQDLIEGVVIEDDYQWVRLAMAYEDMPVAKTLARLVQEAGSRRIALHDSKQAGACWDDVSRPVALAIALARAGRLVDALSHGSDHFETVTGYKRSWEM